MGEQENNVKQFYPNTDENVWLRSCEVEITKPMDGSVSGDIPKWLNGSLLRNGPGSLKVGDMEFKHLFDSSALLHRFKILNGTVTYQCRFLRSQTYVKNHAANRIVITEFGTKAVPDPCHTIFDRIATLFKPGEGLSDNALISIYPFGDEFYTFTESPIIHRIDPETLETTGRLNVYKYISIINHTSHPHVMQNGDVYNLGMAISSTGPVYTIVKFPYSIEGNMFENAHRLANIPVRWPFHPGYMHTFGLTKDYYIIVEQPLAVSLCEFVKTQLLDNPSGSCLNWYPEYKTYFYVVRRCDGEIEKVFQAEAFFYLHIINQYEENGHVVIDICSYKDPAMLDCMYVESMRTMQSNPDYATMFRGRPMRYILPIDSDEIKIEGTCCRAWKEDNEPLSISSEMLYDIGCETPRINYEMFLGKKYRYFYAISSDVDAEVPGQLIKIDTVNKTAKTWAEFNCYPSEPIFVPRPGSKKEDDGVVLAAMVWGKEGDHKVGMIVLDAQNYTELGRATFSTPTPIPKCLHGWYHPSSSTNDKE